MNRINAKVSNRTPLVSGTNSIKRPPRPIPNQLATGLAGSLEPASEASVGKSSPQSGREVRQDVMMPAFDRRHFVKYASTLAATLLPVGALLQGCRKSSPEESVVKNTRRSLRWKKPTLFALNKGQRFSDAFGGHAKRTVTILDCQEFSERGVWQQGWRDVYYKALITVDVDGVQGVVGCGPFYMPVVINGLRLCGEVTRAFSGSFQIEPMDQDVLLSAQDAELPWYPSGTFAFPIQDYRWGSCNFLNAWLGFHDTAQEQMYYHYGVDFGGMAPDKMPLVAMFDGKVTDGRGFRIRSDVLGLEIRYGHMVKEFMRQDIGAGSAIQKNETFGFLGNVGAKKSPHVHIDMLYTSDPSRNVNCFPMIVQAHLEQYDEPLAFPGHKRHCLEGGTLELDGSLSVAPEGQTIVSYQWEFSDGTTANTPKVQRQYDKKGGYSEQLTVITDTGKRATSYVMVLVYPEKDAVDAPYVPSLSHHPVRGLRAGQPVAIRYFGDNVDRNMSLDFGDGSSVTVPSRGSDTLTHVYKTPGVYTVTYRGEGPGGIGTYKRQIVVGEAS